MGAIGRDGALVGQYSVGLWTTPIALLKEHVKHGSGTIGKR